MLKVKANRQEAYRLLHRGSLALSKVEGNGIRVDRKYLDRTMADLDRKITEGERELKESKVWKRWRRAFGEKAKLTSREQLGAVFFDSKVGGRYEVRERTETGRPKTDESAFEWVDHPFPKAYFRVEKMRKAKNTYLANLRRETTPAGFFHPTFNLHTARTFRSSSGADKEEATGSRDVNFQNLPVRNPEMAEWIRRSFVPRKGRRLGEVDFSGIEVKVAYCYHQDPTMRKYLLDPKSDMHRDMAAECYMLSAGQVDKMMRYCAKNMFVFPQFYGSAYFKCAKQLWEAVDLHKLSLPPGTEEKGGDQTGISLRDHLLGKGIKELGPCDPRESPRPGTFEHHLKTVEKRFWKERFPVYDRWRREWYDAYLREGGFNMFTGFRVSGPFARNDVINYPVQGAAFHCLLWCLTELQDWLDGNGMESLIVGQIHDSLVLDLVPAETDEVLSKAREIMTVLLPRRWKWITTPLEVEAEVCPVGESWFTKKAHVEKGGVWVLKG